MTNLIVVIEDEVDLLEVLEYNLQKEGYQTEGFLSTKNVERFLEEEQVALMIVDRNLPGVEGSAFVKTLREKGFETPVIFLSAKDADSEIEEGFMRGGDDYITKPYNMKELLLRIRAILKRAHKDLLGTIKHRDMIIDGKNRSVSIEGEDVELTKLEFDLLYILASNAKQVLSRDMLLETVWTNEEVQTPDKTVNVAINRLKNKIDPGKNKNYIKAVRGVGYQIA